MLEILRPLAVLAVILLPAFAILIPLLNRYVDSEKARLIAEGRECFRSGGSVAECPHRDVYDRTMWMKGFSEARIANKEVED